MYRGSPDPVRVWELPNSLAGDAIVTIMIQGTLTWVIAGLLTRLDVKSERIQPIFYQHAPRPLQDFPADGSASGAVTPPPGEPAAAAADADSNSSKALDGPQIFKAVMAAVLGFFMTPLVSMVGLLEAGRCSLADLQQI
ncbi:unnamed protein product [Closterium sp. Naga37s-1]|nr:unnamed protein product [Closterium sp. Naga37s-1]